MLALAAVDHGTSGLHCAVLGSLYTERLAAPLAVLGQSGRVMTGLRFAAGAAFLRVARRFSAGGWRSLFFRFGNTIANTNFFSP